MLGDTNLGFWEQMGRVLTYRPPAQISIHLNRGIHLTSYSFGSMQWNHNFCPLCGVAVGVDDVVENMKAVNLRCLEGVQWAEIETYKHRGSAEGPTYVVPK